MERGDWEVELERGYGEKELKRGNGEEDLGSYAGLKKKEKNVEKQVLENDVAVGELQWEIVVVVRIHEKH